ncbi:uncharacterized protein LOC112694085 [Sipha flava]|uniref:Uncharacterized protein LOC112694085 n=1 Tax=Sipha flava TaxID=143950 RepID=A0A2S2QK28_9HEMI|nr:uncharacterized protein LOC112694085 [Sipha flava]
MTQALSDDIKCLENVSYDVVKHKVHFEWVSGFENSIKRLAVDVFETIGVTDEKALTTVVKGLDLFQENLRTKMDELVKQIVSKPGLSESAKKFVVEWADACKYQIDLKYHMMGGGPDAQKVRWSFESAIKYIIICATHLADQDDDVEFKKELSDFVKDVMIQSLIDVLENLKSQLNTSKKSS